MNYICLTLNRNSIVFLWRTIEKIQFVLAKHREFELFICFLADKLISRQVFNKYMLSIMLFWINFSRNIIGKSTRWCDRNTRNLYFAIVTIELITKSQIVLEKDGVIPYLWLIIIHSLKYSFNLLLHQMLEKNFKEKVTRNNRKGNNRT